MSHSELRPKGLAALIFFMFFVSGFCGLLYQLVWTRLAFAAFGIITPVLSVVVSVFMLGLALGSWLAGKYAVSFSRRWRFKLTSVYAGLECLIGIGGLAVVGLFEAGQTWLLGAGDFDSFSYLFFSGVILSFAIFPWCVCMGATIPVMMAFVKERQEQETQTFSYLYLANVAGAMLGTIVTAVFLIETLGLYGSLFWGACLNFFVALLSAGLSLRPVSIKNVSSETVSALSKKGTRVLFVPVLFFLSVLFMTGFTSMAMEVIWTRAFTPILGTTIYAFAAILTVYLLATWAGTLLYRWHARDQKEVAVVTLLVRLVYCCFFPILAADPRWWSEVNTPVIRMSAIFSIFPFCCILGYLTAKLIDLLSQGDPKMAGKAYALNALGCICGPLLAGYLFLPLWGVKLSLVLLTLPAVAILFWGIHVFSSETGRPKGREDVSMGDVSPGTDTSGRMSSGRTYSLGYVVSISGILVFLFLSALFLFWSHEDFMARTEGAVIRRDYAATVTCYGQGRKKKLLVNGVGMTALTTVTKFMAHLPLAAHTGRPESALVICLGMGTSFRSAALWGVPTTVVELIPGVRDSFGYFFEDAAEILRKTGTRIVIDDGRRFLRRTKQAFDIITIDPPPPVEASGSGLLYSIEFYNVLKARLKEGGILQQWLPEGEPIVLRAVTNSLCTAFPYVKIFSSFQGWGYHFLASEKPFAMPSAAEFVAKMPAAARADLVAWTVEKDPGALYQWVIDKEYPVSAIVDLKRGPFMTDARPVNEYFLMRRLKKEIWDHDKKGK